MTGKEAIKKLRQYNSVGLCGDKTLFEPIEKDLEMIDLLKKCYYVSSIEKAKTLHLASYGFDNPLDVIKIGEWLDDKS